MTRTLSLVTWSLVALAGACASHDDGVEVVPDKPAPEKLQAPVELTLAATANGGQYDVKLTVKATAAIPSAQARFVPPAGARLASGKLEQDLGPLAAGDERQVAIRIQLPDTFAGNIAAGVDCHMSAGVQLHKGTVVVLGTPATDPGRVTPDGVHLQPARPR